MSTETETHQDDQTADAKVVQIDNETDGESKAEEELSELEKRKIEINSLIDEMKNGENIRQSIIKLQPKLAFIHSEETNQYVHPAFDVPELLKLVVTDILAINNSDDIDDHLEMINTMRDHHMYYFSIEPKQLQSLFDLCVVKCSNEAQSQKVMNIFESIADSWVIEGQINQFYTDYFQPLMQQFNKEENYAMICKFYNFWGFLYYRFADIEQYRVHTKRAKLLGIDPKKMTLEIYNQLQQTLSKPDQGGKCQDLLSMLLDIVTASEQEARLPLSKELSTEQKDEKEEKDDPMNQALSTYSIESKSVLTEEMKSALNYIFAIFATNDDGTMCKDDMTRYIMACMFLSNGI